MAVYPKRTGSKGWYSTVLTFSAGEVHPYDSDLICLLIRSGVIWVNFHRLRDHSKNTGLLGRSISSIFVCTFGTLGQHEFVGLFWLYWGRDQ